MNMSVCHSGYYQFNRIPFGLKNEQMTFKLALNIVLAAYKWNTYLFHLDNILIFSKDSESNFEHI